MIHLSNICVVIIIFTFEFWYSIIYMMMIYCAYSVYQILFLFFIVCLLYSVVWPPNIFLLFEVLQQVSLGMPCRSHCGWIKWWCILGSHYDQYRHIAPVVVGSNTFLRGKCKIGENKRRSSTIGDNKKHNILFSSKFI
jgi:hypothetical protein